METKKSVVTAIAENVKQWAGQNGTVYYHTITFENGDTGQYGSKSAKCEKFTVGQEADYTIEKKVNGQYTNVIIKPIIENGGFKGQPKDSSLIAAQSCLHYACILYAQTQHYHDTAKVLDVAQQFHNWVMAKKTV